MRSFAVVAVFCLISYTTGAPQFRESPRSISDGPIVRNGNQGSSIKTAFGTFPITFSNGLTEQDRALYLPIMKALLKVMETNRPAPEDVNTLLILTRDLLKKVPKGQSIPTLGFGSAFSQFGLDGIKNMGLPETGDIIINIGNQPHIKTSFGAFPLSDVSLMTEEERERFLPATRTFLSILEKDNADPNDINLLLEQSQKLGSFIPESGVKNVAAQPLEAFPAVPTRNAGINTFVGTFPLSNTNGLTPDLRATYLPIMTALLKVMEEDKPAPEDINTLLILTRELIEKIPEGGDSKLGLGSSFGGIDGFTEVLPKTGDLIVYIRDKPYIRTQWGSFPLSENNLMTREERDQFLPVTRTFKSVLEKDNVDIAEISQLLEQSKGLANLVPDNLLGRLGGGLGLGGLLNG